MSPNTPDPERTKKDVELLDHDYFVNADTEYQRHEIAAWKRLREILLAKSETAGEDKLQDPTITPAVELYLEMEKEIAPYKTEYREAVCAWIAHRSMNELIALIKANARSVGTVLEKSCAYYQGLPCNMRCDPSPPTPNPNPPPGEQKPQELDSQIRDLLNKFAISEPGDYTMEQVVRDFRNLFQGKPAGGRE